jgi:hypothetical protein
MNVAELIHESGKLSSAERAEFAASWRDRWATPGNREVAAVTAELLKGAEDFRAGRTHRGDDAFWKCLRSEVSAELERRQLPAANQHA